ncbi:MAG: hypothetical protein WEA81_06880, partial [Dehalococcoidia bacterium]
RANAAAAGFDVLDARDWSAHVTNPLQGLFDFVARLGRRPWGRRLLTWHNRMLRAMTDDDWREFDQAARAHRFVRSRSRYIAHVLTPAAA